MRETSQLPEPLSLDHKIDRDALWPYHEYDTAQQDYAGFDIISLTLYPVQYNPVTHELVHSELTVDIHFVPAGGKTADLHISEAISSRLRSLVTRGKVPSATKSYLDQPLYIIITEDRFVGSWDGTADGDCTLFSCLKKFKESQPNPFSVEIVTTETILQNEDYACGSVLMDELGMASGMDFSDPHCSVEGHDDAAARIRNFIRYAYVSRGAQYVLLGGDADLEIVEGEWGVDHETEAPIIPTRYLNPDGYRVDGPGIPSDLYYSNLEGSFDSNGDGKFGYSTDGADGGDVDLIAEVFVGRVPVDNEAEVARFVEKTIAFAQATPERTLFTGSYMGFGAIANDAKPFLEQVREGSFYHGYATGGVPDAIQQSTLYNKDAAWDKNDVIHAINQNNLLIVNNLGHSAPLHDMKLCAAQYYSPEAYCGAEGNDLEFLSNDIPFVGYTQGCYAGSFDNFHFPIMIGGDPSMTPSDCFIEQVLLGDHGACAYVANTRDGLVQLYTTDGPSNRLHREFIDAIFNEEKTLLGEAYLDSKDDVLIPGDIRMRYVCYSLSLFGDPAIDLNRPDVPLSDIAYLQPHEGPYSGELELMGTAKAGQNTGFSSYELEYRHEDVTEWETAFISTESVDKDLLLAFDTRLAMNGWNLFRLTVTDGSQAATDEIRVEIFNLQCGDLTEDGKVDQADLMYLIGFLFRGFDEPNLWAADVNGDGSVNIQDLTYLISFIYCHRSGKTSHEGSD